MDNNGDIFNLPGIAADSLVHPARADGNDGLSAFLAENRFWGIIQPVRRLMYCHANGITIAHYDPVAADEALRSLEPNRDLLFAYFEGFEEAYEEGYSPSDAGHLSNNRQATALATTQIFDAARLRCRHHQTSPNFESWCALAFCAGVLACQKNRLSARHLLRRSSPQMDHAESYLFRFLLGWSNDWDCLKRKTPVLRFVASCYPTTPLERGVIPSLTERVLDEDVPDVTSETIWRIFNQCFAAGKHTGRESPSLLCQLLADIENGIRPGCAAENARLFRQHLHLGSLCPPDTETVWRGLINLIKEQHPHLVPFQDHPARIIHLLAFLQRMIDGAFWAGLYAARPEAFENFQAWQDQQRD
ncbi:MAG: hypothetical protein ACO3ZW_03070 [Opitutales bacterium]